LSRGSSPGEACRKPNTGLIAVCCIPKLYWMPKNPKFIIRICRVVSSGADATEAGLKALPFESTK